MLGRWRRWSRMRSSGRQPRGDPVGLLLGQAESRVPELVPVRHGRMLVSPFTFFRGAALPMAADLAGTPTSGLRVQLCGDAHLSNFGAFASPERNLVFDVNDFDETLPGPFEWDVKRLAASWPSPAGTTGSPPRTAARSSSRRPRDYRTRCAASPSSRPGCLVRPHGHRGGPRRRSGPRSKPRGSRPPRRCSPRPDTADSIQAQTKLTTVIDGSARIVSDPPMIVPVEDVFADVAGRRAVQASSATVLGKYRRTLQSDRRHLLEQFTLASVARKVVGVGSVGTRAWIVLMDAGDGAEPLFLQAKEAQPSVLGRFAGTANTPTRASGSSPAST